MLHHFSIPRNHRRLMSTRSLQLLALTLFKGPAPARGGPCQVFAAAIGQQQQDLLYLQRAARDHQDDLVGGTCQKLIGQAQKIAKAPSQRLHRDQARTDLAAYHQA